MTIPSISFLGQSISQINRLNDLNSTLADLERQISTGKKFDTLAGFSTTAQTVLKTRINKAQVQSYLDNTTTVSTRIKVMDQAMTSATGAVRQIITGIQTAVRESTTDVGTLSTLAKNALSFLQDLANQEINGRYLFAGTNTTSPPYVNNAQMTANFQTEVTNWLNGTNTTAQFQSNVDAMSNTALGFDPALSTAGPVTVQVDPSTNADYTVNAGTDGFQDMIRALGLMANLKIPDPSVDTPTVSELNDMLSKVLDIAQQGVTEMRTAQSRLGLTSGLIDSIQTNHQADSAMLDGLISDNEGADTTEAVVKVQALQTQLQSSYQVTNLISHLSLVNFL